MKKSAKQSIGIVKLISRLEREAGKRKQPLWRDVALRLSRPRRKMAKVNLWKLEMLSEKNPGKAIIVPGKVLGEGMLKGKIEVAAYSFSVRALKEIEKNKGTAMSLTEALERVKPPKALIAV